MAGIESLATGIKVQETWRMIGYENGVILIFNGVFKTEVIFEFYEIDGCFNNFSIVRICIVVSFLCEFVILLLLLIKFIMDVLFGLLVLELICLSLCFDLCNDFIKCVIECIGLFKLVFQKSVFLKESLCL